MRCRIFFASFAAAFAALPVALLTFGAQAQTADSISPLIVTPQAPQPAQVSPGYHGTLGDVASEAGKSLKGDLDSLQQNIAILHDLNSQNNQEAIDRLGANYASVPNLGTNLGSAISAIDTAKLAENSEALSRNIQGTMDAYGSTAGELVNNVSSAIKNSKYSAQNLPDQAGAQELSEQAKKMATDQAQAALPVLGINYSDVMQLDNNIAGLNANVVSITKTYLNLIKLTGESPSVLTGMPDLNTELATVNGVATEPMKTLAALNDSMAAINSQYSNLNEHKAPVKESVGAINASIQSFTGQLAAANSDMALSLGRPQEQSEAEPQNILNNSSSGAP